MKKYECAVVIAPNVSSDVLENTTKKCKEVITSRGGTVTALDDWGKRGLAYEINYHKEGFYHFYKFEGNKDIIDELNRQLKIDENIIRHMIVRDEYKVAAETKTEGTDAGERKKEEG
ncbi:MAG: 30S ribosomal protein S6 [Candidatus Krumholzibacteria bacterium]|nr:30S ribosomal protein S6 [Candidatus Krumholzibacteria bacterium]